MASALSKLDLSLCGFKRAVFQLYYIHNEHKFTKSKSCSKKGDTEIGPSCGTLDCYTDKIGYNG